MKKKLFYLLILVSLLVLTIRLGEFIFSETLKGKGRAGIKITSVPSGKVYLDGEEVGKTPYENENLEAKTYQVKILGEGAWQGNIELTKGTLSIVNRELSSSSIFSSGEVLTLKKGEGLTITSNPSLAEVEIDGKNYGKTPLKITGLSKGDHILIIAHPNYLKRSNRINLPERMHLALDVDLAISEMPISLSPPAPQILQKLEVKNTPNGFLRVRSSPSLNASEIKRVSEGDELVITGELSGWYKVRLEDGREGYVAEGYVVKR